MEVHHLFLVIAAICGGVSGGLISRAIHEWLSKPRPAEKLPEPTQAAIKGDLQIINRWVAWNHWYLEDEAWRLEAQAIHLQRQRTHPGEPLEVNLAQVAAEMRRRHAALSPTLN